MYDASAAPQPFFGALAPGGGTCDAAATRACWTTGPGAGFNYHDPIETPDGLFQVKLVPGADGKARITIRGSYGSLPFLALPLVPPVVVQVQASNGQCWEADFSTPRLNTAKVFDGHAD